jgi:hypothetical protein
MQFFAQKNTLGRYLTDSDRPVYLLLYADVPLDLQGKCMLVMPINASLSRLAVIFLFKASLTKIDFGLQALDRCLLALAKNCVRYAREVGLLLG